jgi:hypothetical protein
MGESLLYRFLRTIRVPPWGLESSPFGAVHWNPDPSATVQRCHNSGERIWLLSPLPSV